MLHLQLRVVALRGRRDAVERERGGGGGEGERALGEGVAGENERAASDLLPLLLTLEVLLQLLALLVNFLPALQARITDEAIVLLLGLCGGAGEGEGG